MIWKSVLTFDESQVKTIIKEWVLEHPERFGLTGKEEVSECIIKVSKETRGYGIQEWDEIVFNGAEVTVERHD